MRCDCEAFIATWGMNNVETETYAKESTISSFCSIYPIFRFI